MLEIMEIFLNMLLLLSIQSDPLNLFFGISNCLEEISSLSYSIVFL